MAQQTKQKDRTLITWELPLWLFIMVQVLASFGLLFVALLAIELGQFIYQ